MFLTGKLALQYTHLVLIHYLLASYPHAHLFRWHCACSQDGVPASLDNDANQIRVAASAFFSKSSPFQVKAML